MKSSHPEILALSDGRAGNVAMARGLADAVALQCGGVVRQCDLDVPTLIVKTPLRLWAALPARVVLSLAADLGTADVVIGAGRRVAPFVEAIKRDGRARAVQILDCGLPPARFDLVITPAHDGVSGANVVQTLGSVNRITPDGLAAARTAWSGTFGTLPGPRIAVLIGGATKRTPMTAAMTQRLADDLAALAAHTGGTLMITASRRTGEANTALLRAALPEAWFWDGSGDNPYQGMLAWADAIMVTDDSVNMASEAASTPAPVMIYPLLNEGGKIAQFHSALFDAGAASPFAPELPDRSGPPLAETARAANAVAALL